MAVPFSVYVDTTDDVPEFLLLSVGIVVFEGSYKQFVYVVDIL